MSPYDAYARSLTRRSMLSQSGVGIGSIALSSLLAEDLLAAGRTADPLTPKKSHLPPRARNVIFLHMVGAPSQLDLFDYKPVLKEYHGKDCPEEYLKGQRFAFLRGHPRLMGTPFTFEKCGEAGTELSDLLPHLRTVADELAIIKTVHTEQFNHAPAQLFFQTGFERFGRPSMGSWVAYGLGTENRDLPAFVALVTGGVAGAGNALWGSGFLPSVYQGVEFRSKGDPVLFLSNPRGIARRDRRRMIDGIADLNRERLAEVGDPEIATRIAQYEMAFRMQTSVPDLMDISHEPAEVLDRYGADPGKPSFANNCLLARRLVERGVRFVQLFDQGWDHHGNIAESLPRKCKQVDRPTAALLADLKQRGLLEETLVVWGAEFGRTPMLQGSDGSGNTRAKPGRDHHKDAFTVWLAGGGVRGGSTVGRTDDLGYRIVEDPVHVHDLHATILHLLGIDHERLTYRYQGRDFRLTDVAGHVIDKVLA